MVGWAGAPFVRAGVTPPGAAVEPGGRGVDVPLLLCVARTEASLREASAMICLMFLFRRCEGFQRGLRKGFWIGVMSSWSSSRW
jgi:hypothetical protein